jgi:hypothetical protein
LAPVDGGLRRLLASGFVELDFMLVYLRCPCAGRHFVFFPHGEKETKQGKRLPTTTTILSISHSYARGTR